MATIAKTSAATSPPKKGAAKTPAKPATSATTKAVAKAKPVSRAAIKKEPAAATPTPTKSRSARKAEVHPEQRRCYIEVAAYYIAERRGFMGGHEAEDWSLAEIEIDQMLRDGKLNG